ncbi:MAG: redoxin domain-containing protein [Acidobacteriota bacterium]|jgi:thiol-disulfide isomerase/thioredoxin|nr:redoxin domain-containing protein [Acidobacteriota bacterium]MDQ3418553.1 redoxin domain-containing protein [Acidobacteriota bacterium]
MAIVRTWCAVAAVVLFAASVAVTAQDTDFDTKMRDADALLARRQYEDALRIYKDANGLQDKKSPRALLGMARAYQGLKAHKSAADSCTESLKYVGESKVLDAEARNLRGVSLFALGEKADDKRWKQAEEDFRSVLTMVDASPVAQYNLGMTLLKQLRDEEAIKELREFVERAGSMPEAASAKKYIENPRRARENFAPDFSFSTLAGEFLSSDDLRGKVVLIDFWATWCEPCVYATPGLARLHRKYKDEPVVILGISADRDQAPWKAFIEKHKLEWAHFYDDRRMMANRFVVNGYPTYLLLDHEGIIRYRQQGWNSQVDSQLDGEIRSLLKKAKAAPQQ